MTEKVPAFPCFGEKTICTGAVKVGHGFSFKVLRRRGWRPVNSALGRSRHMPKVQPRMVLHRMHRCAEAQTKRLGLVMRHVALAPPAAARAAHLHCHSYRLPPHAHISVAHRFQRLRQIARLRRRRPNMAVNRSASSCVLIHNLSFPTGLPIDAFQFCRSLSQIFNTAKKIGSGCFEGRRSL